MPGISRNLTRLAYSSLPDSSRRSIRSSPTTRGAKPATSSGTAATPHPEPSSIGMPSNQSMLPAYMGWRTMRYGPSVTTRCARAVCTRTWGGREGVEAEGLPDHDHAQGDQHSAQRLGPDGHVRPPEAPRVQTDQHEAQRLLTEAFGLVGRR